MAKVKSKSKSTAKSKSKKVEKEAKTPSECYDDFMESVQKAEKAKTAKTRNKWIKIAQEAYEELLACDDTDLSAAKRRRAKRTMNFLEDLDEK